MSASFYRFCLCLTVFAANIFAQSSDDNSSVVLQQSKYNSQTIKFAQAGKISILGAPNGSIEVIGWNRNSVEISSEIIVLAENEADIKRISGLCDYHTKSGIRDFHIKTLRLKNNTSIKESGGAKSSSLEKSSCTINYQIKVPVFTDLDIDGGDGRLVVSGVSGAMRIKFLSSNAELNLIGGKILITIGSGSVKTKISSKTWREGSAEIRLGAGDLTVFLSQTMDANLTAAVLRRGKLINRFIPLHAPFRIVGNRNKLSAKIGRGGTDFRFFVRNGSVTLENLESALAK